MALFNSYNRAVALGNMGADAEVRTLQSGTQVCDFSIAVNERRKQGEEWIDETTWIPCTVWGKAAEMMPQYARKGMAVLVEGKFKMDEWEDKNGGGRRSKLKINVDNITFNPGNRKNNEGNGGGGGQSYSSTGQPPQNQQAPAGDEDDNNLGIPDA